MSTSTLGNGNKKKACRKCNRSFTMDCYINFKNGKTETKICSICRTVSLECHKRAREAKKAASTMAAASPAPSLDSITSPLPYPLEQTSSTMVNHTQYAGSYQLYQEVHGSGICGSAMVEPETAFDNYTSGPVADVIDQFTHINDPYKYPQYPLPH